MTLLIGNLTQVIIPKYIRETPMDSVGCEHVYVFINKRAKMILKEVMTWRRRGDIGGVGKHGRNGNDINIVVCAKF